MPEASAKETAPSRRRARLLCIATVLVLSGWAAPHPVITTQIAKVKSSAYTCIADISSTWTAGDVKSKLFKILRECLPQYRVPR
jgi:hypothetical protein